MFKIIFLLVSLLSFKTFSQSSEPPNIDERKCGIDQTLLIAFLNGIRSNTSSALKSSENIEALVVGSESPTLISPNGLDDICYKYIYNQTEEYLDLIEVFAQKIREADPTQSENQVYKNVSKLLILDEIPSVLRGEVDWEEELTNLETEHFARTEYHTLHVETAPIVIKDLKERSVLVVSHSQGNLFANLIFGEIQRDTTLAHRFKHYANLQVASAANNIAAESNSFGDYMTSKQDLVVNSLALFFEVLPSNVEINYADFVVPDWKGHGFVEVYTNSKVNGQLDGETNFRSMSSIFMDKLEGLAKKIMLDPTKNGTIAESLVNIGNNSISYNYKIAGLAQDDLFTHIIVSKGEKLVDEVFYAQEELIAKEDFTLTNGNLHYDYLYMGSENNKFLKFQICLDEECRPIGKSSYNVSALSFFIEPDSTNSYGNIKVNTESELAISARNDYSIQLAPVDGSGYDGPNPFFGAKESGFGFADSAAFPTIHCIYSQFDFNSCRTETWTCEVPSYIYDGKYVGVTDARSFNDFSVTTVYNGEEFLVFSEQREYKLNYQEFVPNCVPQ